jgi:ribosome-associated protein
MDIRKKLKLAVTALEDIKARDIAVFDVRHLTSLFDRVIIATAESARQTKALANNVREKLKEAGATIHGMEGEDAGEWILVDAGDIVVHVMQPTMREYYNLEELWGQPKKRAPRAKAAAAAAA